MWRSNIKGTELSRYKERPHGDEGPLHLRATCALDRLIYLSGRQSHVADRVPQILCRVQQLRSSSQFLRAASCAFLERAKWLFDLRKAFSRMFWSEDARLLSCFRLLTRTWQCLAILLSGNGKRHPLLAFFSVAIA